MIRHNVTWYSAPDIATNHAKYPCTQVYVWIVSADQKVVIVSKDGHAWQLAGGKPEGSETRQETATREVFEETGLATHSFADKLTFFGYQVVEDVQDDKITATYIQARYMLILPEDASNYSLNVDFEDSNQTLSDVVRFVRFVPLSELEQTIKWVAMSDEYKMVKRAIYE